MVEREGVIKYQLNYQRQAVLRSVDVSEIEAWRCICIRLGMIGQVPGRYQGFGYGNLSQRWPTAKDSGFIISGTQTGGIAMLDTGGYVWVKSCDPYRNTVDALGLIEPSSEAMTHGQIYLLRTEVNAVIHAHCPEIWCHTDELGIPFTGADVPYGTPQMAAAVAELFTQTRVAQMGIFAMAGHEDGVVVFGENFTSAASVLLKYLAPAVALFREQDSL